MCSPQTEDQPILSSHTVAWADRTAPVQSHPVQSHPAQSDPAQSDPVQSDPVQPDLVHLPLSNLTPPIRPRPVRSVSRSNRCLALPELPPSSTLVLCPSRLHPAHPAHQSPTRAIWCSTRASSIQHIQHIQRISPLPELFGALPEPAPSSNPAHPAHQPPTRATSLHST